MVCGWDHSDPEHGKNVKTQNLSNAKALGLSYRGQSEPRGKSVVKIAYMTFVILKSHDFLLRFFKDLSDFLVIFCVIFQ